MFYTSYKPLMVLSLICGMCFGSFLQPFLRGKPPLSLPYSLGILAVTGLFGWWVMIMYRRAAVPDDPDFPEHVATRYTAPVVATIGFITGIVIVVMTKN